MMKAPEPLYPCKFCSDEYSWPASDLAWSKRYQDWVCGECWCDNCHNDDYEPDERGQRLSEFLSDRQESKLATLRAKSKAYDDGQEAWAVKCPSGQLAHTGTQDECSRKCADLNAADMFLDGREYTYIKVRVCKEVDR